MASRTRMYYSMPALSARVDERKGRLLLEIPGDVTSSQVNELKHELRAILGQHGSENWSDLYLDMRSARMVDSMGINWLFAEAVRLREEKRSLVIRISSPAINRVMEFAGLNKVTLIKFRRRKQTR